MTEQVHLVVATPCFGGQVSTIYASSIFHLQSAVRSLSNVKLKIEMRDGDALITRARANLMTLFLNDPTATHFLFVDADIGFTPDQVFRLIESGADVVAGSYPIKRVNWDKAKRAIDTGASERRCRRTRLCAGNRKPGSCCRGQRLYPRALRRHRIPDDPPSCLREDVRASRLCLAAILSRTFARCAGGEARTGLPCSNA